MGIDSAKLQESCRIEMMKVYKNIDEHIRSFPKNVQVSLKKIRETIKFVAPRAQETIKYGIPTFVLDGKNLVHFGGFKNHIGFYPTPAAIKEFKSELKEYKLSKGAIQFPIGKAIPFGLIKRIVRFRVDQDVPILKSKKSKHIHRHKDGTIWGKGELLGKKMHGYWEWYRKDGTKMRSGYLDKDKQIGKWTTFDSKGGVVKITNFDK